jgi:hypothetical protein
MRRHHVCDDLLTGAAVGFSRVDHSRSAMALGSFVAAAVAPHAILASICATEKGLERRVF